MASDRRERGDITRKKGFFDIQQIESKIIFLDEITKGNQKVEF